jgi:hypothetical protein
MIAPAANGNTTGRDSWRWSYWSVLVALFAWAAWQRFSLPLDPIADPDTWGYLAPALRKLLGAEFGHTHGRNFVYPAFVFLLLRVFGDFRAIVITQHLLGLLAGGMLLVTWRRMRVFLPDSRLSPAVRDSLGLIAATIYLLAGEPIRFELQLRPEGVCAFLVSISLYFAIQFVSCCFVEQRRGAAVIYGIWTAFSSVLLASAKPSFALVGLLALLPVGLFFFRRGWFWQKITLGGGAALCAVLLLLPEYFLSRNDESSRTFLPITLFSVHADLIRDQMADDLGRGAEIPYPRDWLQGVHDALATEMAKSHEARPGHFHSLGFDPDYLMSNKSSIVAQMHREFEKDVPALCAFYRFYYLRIWRQRPLPVLRKVASQMALFYSRMCPAYNRENTLWLANQYGDGANILALPPYLELWMAWPAAVEFVNRTQLLAQSAPAIRQCAPLRMALSLLSGMYTPLFLIACALSLGVLFQAHFRRRLGWLAALVLFVYSYNLASCLEVAIIQSLEVRRFVTVQMFFATFAQFLAVWFVLEFFLERRATRKIPLR